jgi:hypothetical protein
MLWVMVMVYVFGINIKVVCCDGIILKIKIDHESKVRMFWSHLCLENRFWIVV